MRVPEYTKFYREFKALEARVEVLENPKKKSRKKAKKK